MVVYFLSNISKLFPIFILSFCLIFHLSGYHTFFPYNSPFVKNVKKDEKPFLVS